MPNNSDSIDPSLARAHKKNILVIAALTLLTFANCLPNGFVGDDEFLFIKNPFFHSLSNLPKLFTSDYIADQNAVFNDVSENINSGSVAYRPVLSLSFFIDYGIWQKNPFGYHLTNVALHLINSILVYWLVFLTLKDPLAALLAAIIFSVHPLKSEAISSIGYRADALAALFVLVSFVHFIKSKTAPGLNSLVAHFAFFLALFTKESAVVFPALVVFYDIFIERIKLVQIVKGFYSCYLGFIAVLAFYLFVYIFVFPNSSLNAVRAMSSLSVHIATIIWIMGHYLTLFVFPMLVKLLPPLYSPPVKAFLGPQTAMALAAVALYFGLLVYSVRKNKRAAFFLVWFLLAFIPVSNIIVIANPLAYRFMYLPSLGLAAFAGMALVRIRPVLDLKSKKIFGMVTVLVVGICMVTTVFLNFNWQNNTMMAIAMVRDFPDYPMGYMHAGMEYFNAGLHDKAEELLKRSIELGLDDPRGLYLMGLIAINDLEKSRFYFEQCVRTFPSFAYAYAGLGRIEFMEKNYGQAVSRLMTSIALNTNWKVYIYLAQIYIVENRYDELEKMLEQASRRLPEDQLKAVKTVIQMIEEDGSIVPFDVGI